MKLKQVLGIMLSVLMLAIVGCGGGGGGGFLASSSTVTGKAAKGPIGGGVVTFYQINADGTQGAQLTTTPATVTTKSSGPSFGNYSATVAYSGPLLIKVTGGSYTDEITGGTVQMGTNSLTAAVPSASGAVTAAVTPLTDIAVKKLTSNTAAGITAANTGVAKAFGLSGVDLITASPTADPNYKFALAVISKAAGADATAVTTLLTQTLAPNISVTAGGGSITNPGISSTIAAATTGAFNNPNVNPTGTLPGISATSVAGVSVVATPTAGAINTPVAVNATVKQVDGAASVGTTVNFAIASGSGSLSAASAVTDSNGVATVNLTSAVEGVIDLTASAGNLTSALSVTFADPNKPGTVTLTSSLTNSIVNNAVTLSATVTRVAGGNVPDGTVVTFATTAGTLSSTTATTTNGVASVTINSAVVTTASITAKAGTSPVVTSLPVTVGFIPNPNLPGGISIAASSNLLFVGQGPVTITATVSPAGQGGVIPNGTPVTFATSAGTITASATTNNGVATASLNSAAAATASVTASVAGITSAPVSVQFKTTPTLVTIKLSTSGTLPANTYISSISATVAGPQGVTLGSADVSGVGGTSVLPTNPNAPAGIPATFSNSLFQANPNAPGGVLFALLNAVGIPTGEFATFIYTIAPGNFPQPSDFSILPGATVQGFFYSNPAVLSSAQSVTPPVSVVMSVTVQ